LVADRDDRVKKSTNDSWTHRAPTLSSALANLPIALLDPKGMVVCFKLGNPCGLAARARSRPGKQCWSDGKSDIVVLEASAGG
jgi:hypothetical protein